MAATWYPLSLGDPQFRVRDPWRGQPPRFVGQRGLIVEDQAIGGFPSEAVGVDSSHTELVSVRPPWGAGVSRVRGQGSEPGDSPLPFSDPRGC